MVKLGLIFPQAEAARLAASLVLAGITFTAFQRGADSVSLVVTADSLDQIGSIFDTAEKS
jgi:hypothetical protein